MASAANQQRSKTIVWTQQADGDFNTLKSLINQCTKLYLEIPVILYTDAPDYAYLCQVQTQPDGSLVEQPIWFLSGTFAGAQTRWSTIEKEVYAIYWALKKLDDLLSGIRFTIRTDHWNLLYLLK